MSERIESVVTSIDNSEKTTNKKAGRRIIEDTDISAMFGIEMETKAKKRK